MIEINRSQESTFLQGRFESFCGDVPKCAQCVINDPLCDVESFTNCFGRSAYVGNLLQSHALYRIFVAIVIFFCWFVGRCAFCAYLCLPYIIEHCSGL